MKKKVLLISVAIIAVLAMSVMMLAGCSKYSDFADQGQKDIAKDAPVLKVATNAEFPPFEFMKNNKYDGFDIALINAIATKLGMKVELKNMDFDAIIAAVNGGGYDVAVAGMTVNEERAKQVNFSTNYFATSQVIVVKNECTKFDALEGAESIVNALKNTKIHVATGQIGHYFAEGNDSFGYDGIEGANVVKYTSVLLAAQGIKGDEAAFFDKDVAKNFCAGNPAYKMIDVALTEESYAVAVNKDKAELLTKINTALAELTADGTVKKIAEYYKLG